MKSNGQEPTIVTYNVLIYNSTLKLEMEIAKAFLAEMRSVGIQPDVSTYCIMVQGYIREGNFKTAWDIYYSMVERGIASNPVVATALLSVYAKTSDLEGLKKAWNVLFKRSFKDEILDGGEDTNRQMKAKPNIITYTVIAHSLLKKITSPVVAYELYQKFCAELFDYLSVNREKNLGTKSLFDHARTQRLNPDCAFFNVFISILAIRLQNMSLATKVYQDMIRRRVWPDVATYTIIMAGYGIRNRPDVAESIYKIMKERNIEPNIFTFAVLARAWAYQNNLPKMQEIHEEMLSCGILPDQRVYLIYKKFLEKMGVASGSVEWAEEDSREDSDDLFDVRNPLKTATASALSEGISCR